MPQRKLGGGKNEKTDSKLKSWLRANKFKVSDNAFVYRVILLRLFMLSHNARAIILVYIISHYQGLISLTSRMLLRSKYGIECSTRKIGFGLMLPHPRNIIISAETIGDNVQINQNVTIGGNMKKTKIRGVNDIQKLPRILNNVVICPNSIVGGPVIINDNVIVGANCVCTHDVESNSLVYNNCNISKKKIIVKQGTYKTL